MADITVVATAKERAKLPVIRVGNILGLVLGDPNVDDDDAVDDDDSTTDGIQYHGPDRVGRNFMIMPPTVYQGETNETFDVMFRAGGPMYAIGDNKVVITLTIPLGLLSAAGLTKNNISVRTRGSVSPGGRLKEVDREVDVDGAPADAQPVEIVADDDVSSDGMVVISLDSINIGGSITLTYKLENDDNDSGLIELPVGPPGNDPDRSAFTATTMIPTVNTLLNAPGDLIPATTVSGGRVLPRAGSGTITMTPEQGEAGDDIRKITLTYEAGTPLSNVTLEIDVKGIVVEDDDETTETEELQGDLKKKVKYGYVDYKSEDFFT